MKAPLILKEVKEVKSLFLSKTFLAICFTTVAALAPIVGSAVKENKLSVDNAVQIVLVLTGAGTAVVGRAAANNSLVYTPNGIPGTNKADVLPAPEAEQGDSIEGTINNAGVAAVSSTDSIELGTIDHLVDPEVDTEFMSDPVTQQLDNPKQDFI